VFTKRTGEKKHKWSYNMRSSLLTFIGNMMPGGYRTVMNEEFYGAMYVCERTFASSNHHVHLRSDDCQVKADMVRVMIIS
jgi:hypothetical protein